jgi:hypothetical protein
VPAFPADIGADFEAYAPGTATVTVRSINPDTGATLETADVTALKRTRKRSPFTVGGGGELSADDCRFVCRTSSLGFTPKTRDEIEDADGVTWQVVDAELIGFGELVACNVTKKRS